MSNSNEYMREYMLDRYHIRREEAIDHLGGKCESCGKTEDLEIDHIDPSAKEIDLGRLWNVSENRFWEEIEKCQLLCSTCHRQKSFREKRNGEFVCSCGKLYEDLAAYMGHCRWCK